MAKRVVFLDGNSLTMNLLNDIFRDNAMKIFVSEETLEKVGLARKALDDYIMEASSIK